GEDGPHPCHVQPCTRAAHLRPEHLPRPSPLRAGRSSPAGHGSFPGSAGPLATPSSDFVMVDFTPLIFRLTSDLWKNHPHSQFGCDLLGALPAPPAPALIPSRSVNANS